MKRSFTLFATVVTLVIVTTNSFSQCLTGGSFTVSTNNTFDVNSEGFLGDFSWTSGGSGAIESTPVSAGTSKTLTTSTFFLPASQTTIAWSFNLSGTANCTSYTVVAKYSQNGVIKTVDVCSGAALSTTGANLVFAAVAPSEIIGQNFQLQITFNSSSTGSKVLALDNFKTNAFNSAITLPVTISYFSAAADAGKIKLTWMVSAESNVNRYEIEKSSNGKTFAKVGQVAATGLVQYTYVDLNTSTGSNYYRLKAVDNDGKYKYSTVVLFKVGKSGIALRAYPSPTTKELTLQHDNAIETSVIDIVSVDGKLVKTVKPAVGNVETTIDVSSFKKGLYFVRYLNSDGEVETLKLIKQ